MAIDTSRVGIAAAIPARAGAALPRALAALLCVYAGAALAHGGLTMEKDTCKLQLGRDVIHFTGHQPDRAETEEFCEDIPGTGRTIIVLDDVEHALRDTPLEFRIVRAGIQGAVDAAVVVRLPPRAYPTGSVSLEYGFAEPGQFVGIVTDGARGKLVSRFPFSVGGGMGRLRHAGVLAAIVALGPPLFFVPRAIRGGRARGTT